MFISFDLKLVNWTSINNTYGVSKLIVSDKHPKSISTDFVFSLKSRCDLEERLMQEKSFKPGEKAQILKGPFTNLVGSIHAIEPKKRVTLLFDIMGRKTTTSIPTAELRTV